MKSQTEATQMALPLICILYIILIVSFVDASTSDAKALSLRFSQEVDSLKTIYTTENDPSTTSQAGNMFDLIALVDITITALDIHSVSNNNQSFEIWSRSGGHVNHEKSSYGWYLKACGIVSSQGLGMPTHIDSLIPLYVETNERVGIYTVFTDGAYLSYSKGTLGVGSVFVQNNSLQILEGIGSVYPFSTVFKNRIWNGSVYYMIGNQARGRNLQVTSRNSCHMPSLHPSSYPSLQPSKFLSTHPSHFPSFRPSHRPTTKPTILPTLSTDFPSIKSSNVPSIHPSQHYTFSPSEKPSEILIVQKQASTQPSSFPSVSMTGSSNSPNILQTNAPGHFTNHPSVAPSIFTDPPLQNMSVTPTITNKFIPTVSPMPTGIPSISQAPSISFKPSVSLRPSVSPSTSHFPSVSFQPTSSSQPSNHPSLSTNPSIESPSAHPSLSHSPAYSSKPTERHSPNSIPSEALFLLEPTKSPMPSFLPSISHRPSISFTPSTNPTEVPSIKTSSPPTSMFTSGESNPTLVGVIGSVIAASASATSASSASSSSASAAISSTSALHHLGRLEVGEESEYQRQIREKKEKERRSSRRLKLLAKHRQDLAVRHLPMFDEDSSTLDMRASSSSIQAYLTSNYYFIVQSLSKFYVRDPCVRSPRSSISDLSSSGSCSEEIDCFEFEYIEKNSMDLDICFEPIRSSLGTSLSLPMNQFKDSRRVSFANTSTVGMVLTDDHRVNLIGDPGYPPISLTFPKNQRDNRQRFTSTSLYSDCIKDNQDTKGYSVYDDDDNDDSNIRV